MKTSLTGLFIVICIGFLPVKASSQVVLPPASVVQHYKDQNRRIQSHSIQQAIAIGNGDTLYTSYQSIVDSFLWIGYTMFFKPVIGFPLGNNLIKLNSGSWTSRTVDSTMFYWDFSTNPGHNWTIYQDSTTLLTGQYLGMDTIGHFSTSLPIWKYKLTSSGSRFDSLHHKEIWLSELGIIRCPDFRAFPYEKTELILTGYQSPTFNKGLRLNTQTFAPHSPGDSIIIKYVKENAYHASLRYNHIIYYHLSAHLSTATNIQKWLAKTTKFEYQHGEYLLIEEKSVDTIDVNILPSTNERILPWVTNRIIYLFDSLPFLSNPDTYVERTYGNAFSATQNAYAPIWTSNQPQPGYKQINFRGDWGFQSEIIINRYGNGAPYREFESTCLYRTVGNRRWGSIPTLTVGIKDENELVQLRSYPNPATSFIHFIDEKMNSQQVKVNIYDSRGSLIRQAEATFPLQIDVSELNAGLYLASFIGTNGYSKYARFVKINP